MNSSSNLAEITNIITNNCYRRGKYIMLLNLSVSSYTYGNTTFAITIPTLWTAISVDISGINNCITFKRSLFIYYLEL